MPGKRSTKGINKFASVAMKPVPEPDRKPYFTTFLRSISGRNMLVTLTCATGLEECPLTLDSISDDALGSLPGVTFMKNEPTVRKMTLPCGHSFGAMNVLYYFARRKMQCPCCRAGPNEAMDPESVPAHFRVPMLTRVLEEQRREIQEGIAEDAEEARRVSRTLGLGALAIPAELLELMRSRPIVMLTDVDLTVFAHDFGTGEVGVQFQFRLYVAVDDMRRGGDAMFDMRLNERRALSQHIVDLGLRNISLAVHARTMAGGVSELARCAPFPAGGGDSLSAETRVPMMILPPQIVLAGNTSFEILRDSRTRNR